MPLSSTVTVGTDEVVVDLLNDAKLVVHVTITPQNNETRKAHLTRLQALFAALDPSGTIQKKMGVDYKIELRPVEPTTYEKYETNAWVMDTATFHADCVTYVQA